MPWSSLAVLLHLSRMRSEFAVARALAERFPTEAEWQSFLQDPVVHEEINALSGVIADIRGGHINPVDLTPTVVAKMATPHMDRALECVALTAERLGIATEDLLLTLVTP